VIQAMGKMRRKEIEAEKAKAEEPAPPTKAEVLLTEIRDLLRKNP
jgi:large-conductance mechanosensitive channel